MRKGQVPVDHLLNKPDRNPPPAPQHSRRCSRVAHQPAFESLVGLLKQGHKLLVLRAAALDLGQALSQLGELRQSLIALTAHLLDVLTLGRCCVRRSLCMARQGARHERDVCLIRDAPVNSYF